jgi:hypothetical protein
MTLLLTSIAPKSFPVNQITEEFLLQSRGRICYRNAFQIEEIALLGSISIHPEKGPMAIMTYIYGPRAGSAGTIRETEFVSQGWNLVDLSDEPKIFGAITPAYPASFPVNLADLDTSMDLLEQWIDHTRKAIKDENASRAEITLNHAKFNADMVRFRLAAVRDFHLIDPQIFDTTRTLLESFTGEFGALRQQISTQNWSASNSLFSSVSSFFADNTFKVINAFTSKYKKTFVIFKKFLKLRTAAIDLLQSLSQAQKSSKVVRETIQRLQAEVAMYDDAVRKIRETAASEGISIDDAINRHSSLEGAPGAAAVVAAFAAVGITISVQTASVIVSILAFIGMALIFGPISAISHKWLGSSDDNYFMQQARMQLLIMEIQEAKARGEEPNADEINKRINAYLGAQTSFTEEEITSLANSVDEGVLKREINRQKDDIVDARPPQIPHADLPIDKDLRPPKLPGVFKKEEPGVFKKEEEESIFPLLLGLGLLAVPVGAILLGRKE